MTLIDYTLLDQPRLTLSLEREGMLWIAVDAADGDSVHARGDLLPVVRWMRAHALLGHCQIDEESVEREYELAAQAAVAWARAQGSGGEGTGRTVAPPKQHSVRVGDRLAPVIALYPKGAA